MKTQSSRRLNTMIKISLLSAIAFVLMYLELPLPLFPDWLKIDISDIPAMLGAFALGPIPAIFIELLKNILHILFKGTSSAFIGELANFLVGCALVVPAGIIYRSNKTRKNALIGILVSIVVMIVSAALLNYFLLLPFYAKAFHFVLPNSVIYTAIIPFNLLKGFLVGGLTIGIYKSVSPILHRESRNDSVTAKDYNKM